MASSSSSSSSAVAAWQACVKQIKLLRTYPAGDPRVKTAIEIPLQICSAFTGVAWDVSCPTTWAACTALRRLVNDASQQDVIGLSDTHGPVASAMRQQVSDSGLLQHLPAMLTATSEQLTAHKASLTPDGPSTAHTASAVSTVDDPVVRAEALLAVVRSVHQLWMLGTDSVNVALALAPSILQLVRASFEAADAHCRVWKSNQQALRQLGAERFLAVAQLLRVCCAVMGSLTAVLICVQPDNLEWHERPGGAALQNSPHCLPVLSWLSAVAVLATTGWWEHSEASNTNTAESASTAWQQININSSCVTPCHRTLYKRLGLSSCTCLFTAGLLHHLASTPELAAYTVRSLLESSIGTLAQMPLPGQPSCQPEGALRVTDQEWEFRQQLCALLAPLYVQWAVWLLDNKPSSSSTSSSGTSRRSTSSRSSSTNPAQLTPGAQFQQDLWHAAIGCANSLEFWSKIGAHQQPVASQPQAPRQQQRHTDAQQAGAFMPPDRQLPLLVLTEAIPQVIKVLGTLLKRQQQKYQAKAASFLRSLCMLLQHSVQKDGGSASASAPTAHPSTQVVGPQVVRDNMLTVLQVLDAAVRYLAANQPNSKAAAEVLQALHALGWLCSTLPGLLFACGSLDSTNVHQLCSMLSSLLKVGAVYGTFAGVPHTEECVTLCQGGVMCGVEEMFRCAVVTSKEAQITSSGGCSSSSNTTAQSDQQESADSYSSADVQPVLVLWGRCLLLLAQQLPQCTSPAAAAAWLQKSWNAVSLTTHVCQAWISLPSVTEKLSAAGYQPQQMLHQLQQLQAALNRVPPHNPAPPLLAALGQQLGAVGQRLCSVAVPIVCNNPACVNVAGPSDILLVCGRSCVCGGCWTARYCSQSCQRVHWKAGHKPVCKALAAAAAAAAKVAEETAAASAEVEAAAVSDTKAADATLG